MCSKIENLCGYLELNDEDQAALIIKSQIQDNVTLQDYYIEPGKGMNNTTPEQTQSLIEAGFREFSVICGVVFVRTDRQSGADIRIEFQPNSGMRSGGGFALGLANRSGRIRLNSERDLGSLERIQRTRLIQALIQHEVMHTYGWDHVDVSEEDYIMNPHLTGRYFHSDEAINLQEKWDDPQSDFWIPPQSPVSIRVQELVKEVSSFRKVYDSKLLERNKLGPDWRRDHPVELEHIKNHEKIVDMYQELGDNSREWWRLNNQWIGVKRARTS